MNETTKLWVSVLVAFGAAVGLVIGVILPAEYSLDPLGSGRALGIFGLSAGGTSAVVSAQEAHRSDQITVQLAPFESVEYSYQMERGATLVFSWAASDEVVFNLHSSPAILPAGRPANYAESFAAGRAEADQGTYTATFTGRHGWFWENRTNTDVTLKLAAAGFMHDAQRSSLEGIEARPLNPAL